MRRHFRCFWYHLRSSEEVEGQLPEESVRGIDNQLGEPGPMSMMVKMADAEILFHDVPDLGDGLVPLFLIWGQSGTSSVLSHDAVLDAVKTQKLPVQVQYLYPWLLELNILTA